jgi:hypothetical protein
MTTQPLALGQPVVSMALAPLDLSVLVPVLDEADSVLELAQRVAVVLDGLGRSFEIVFVDDGSCDATPLRVREAHERDGRVKLVRLRRNFGKAAALLATCRTTRRRSHACSSPSSRATSTWCRAGSATGATRPPSGCPRACSTG